MSKEDPLRGLLSPGPSLEGATEDEHDQEWDSELAEDDGSDRSSSSGSDDENEQENSESGHKEVDQKVLHALKAIQAKYQDEDVVFEEDILSDSEISKEFPEEDDLEVLLDLESDGGDEDVRHAPGQQEGAGEGDGEAREHNCGPTAAAAGQQKQQQLNSSAAARRALWESMDVDQFQGHPQQAAAATWQLPEAAAPWDEAAGAASAVATAAGDWGAGEGSDLLAFGAVLGPLEAEDPIARRTRAHHCLNDISLEELEQMLQVDEDMEEMNAADKDEYQRFLESLRNFPELPSITLDGEDSEDEDFALELAGLLQSESDGEKENKDRGKKRKRVAEPSKPFATRSTRPRWTRAAPGSKAAREHRLRPLAPRGIAPSFGPVTASGAAGSIDFGFAGSALSELALTALQDSKAAAAEVAAGRPYVVWRAPLPGYEGPLARRDAAEGALRALPGAFTPPQYRQLYRMLHQHVQLLTQVYTMAVGSEGSENGKVAREAAAMLTELREFKEKQEQSRRQQGIPAYDLDALGLPSSGPGGAGRAGGSGSNSSRDTRADWAPPRPPTAIYTVADLALLRKVPSLLGRLPPAPPLPAHGEEQEQASRREQAEGREVAAGASPSQGAAGGPPSAEQRQAASGTTAEGSPQCDGAQVGREAGAVGPQQEDGEGGGDEEQAREGEAAPERRKKKKRRKKPTEHALWQGLSERAQQAVGDVEELMDPGVKPQPPTFLPSAQMLFTPAEDDLLATAMLRHGFDWAAIRRDFFPNKSEKVLYHRKKNRCISSVPDNCLKKAAALITGALRPDEIALLEQALNFYGKAPHRWESIVRDHLPYRQPNVLATLWAQHTNGASLLKKKGKHKQQEQAEQEQPPQQQQPEAAQGMRPVFLSNNAPAEEQQQQQEGCGGLAEQAAGAEAAQQQQWGAGGGGGRAGLPPRMPLGAGAQLHSVLQGLFPPGVEVPFPLQLSAAVAAVAAASGTPLPGPLAVVLPQGVPPPPGMIAVGLAEGAAIQHWELAAQLFRAAPPPPQAQQQQGQQAQQGHQGGDHAAEGREAPRRQPTLSVQTGGPQAEADPGCHPLTVNSPTHDVATELQRLLNGEGSNPPLLLASPAGQGATGRGGGARRRRGRRRVGLFQEDNKEGLAGGLRSGGMGSGVGGEDWEEQLYQPIHLPGLPAAPGQRALAPAAGTASLGAHGGRHAAPAGAGPMASKGRRMHFEAEELGDSEEEEGERGPPHLGLPPSHLPSLLPHQSALPAVSDQMLPILPLFAPVPLAPPTLAPLVGPQPMGLPAEQQLQMLQQPGPEFEAEELTDTDDEASGRPPSAHPSPAASAREVLVPREGVPASAAAAAVQPAGGRRRGQRRPIPKKPIRGSKRPAAGIQGGAGPAPGQEPPPQCGAGGGPPEQPAAPSRAAQQQRPSSSAAAVVVASAAVGPDLRRQQAQQPAFEQDYLSDCEDEGLADKGYAPPSPMATDASPPARQQLTEVEPAGAASTLGAPVEAAAGTVPEEDAPAGPGLQQPEAPTAAAVPAQQEQQEAAGMAEESAAEPGLASPPAGSAAAAGGEAGGGAKVVEEATPSPPAPAQKLRRAAAQQASKNITAWVTVGSRAAAIAAKKEAPAAAADGPEPGGAAGAEAAPIGGGGVAGQPPAHNSRAGVVEEGGSRAQRSPPSGPASQQGGARTEQPPASEVGSAVAQKGGSKGQQSPLPKAGAAADQMDNNTQQPSPPKAPVAQKGSNGQQSPGPKAGGTGGNKVGSKGQQSPPPKAAVAAAQKGVAAKGAPPVKPLRASERQKQRQQQGEAVGQPPAGAPAAAAPATAAASPPSNGANKHQQTPSMTEAAAEQAGRDPSVTMRVRPQRRKWAGTGGPPAHMKPTSGAPAVGGTARASSGEGTTAPADAPLPPQQQQQPAAGSSRAAADVAAPPCAAAAVPAATPHGENAAQPAAAPLQVLSQQPLQPQPLCEQSGPEVQNPASALALPVPPAPQLEAQPQLAQQAQHQQKQGGGGTGPRPAPTWSGEEDRLLIKHMLAAGGKLDAQQLEELAAKVGGDAAGRTVAVVEARCAEVFARFVQKMEERKRQQQQQERGGCPPCLSGS